MKNMHPTQNKPSLPSLKDNLTLSVLLLFAGLSHSLFAQQNHQLQIGLEEGSLSSNATAFENRQGSEHEITLVVNEFSGQLTFTVEIPSEGLTGYDNKDRGTSGSIENIVDDIDSIGWPDTSGPENWQVSPQGDKLSVTINLNQIDENFPMEWEIEFTQTEEGSGEITTNDWSSHQRRLIEEEDKSFDDPDGEGEVYGLDNPPPTTIRLLPGFITLNDVGNEQVQKFQDGEPTPEFRVGTEENHITADQVQGFFWTWEPVSGDDETPDLSAMEDNYEDGQRHKHFSDHEAATPYIPRPRWFSQNGSRWQPAPGMSPSDEEGAPMEVRWRIQVTVTLNGGEEFVLEEDDGLEMEVFIPRPTVTRPRVVGTPDIGVVNGVETVIGQGSFLRSAACINKDGMIEENKFYKKIIESHEGYHLRQWATIEPWSRLFDADGLYEAKLKDMSGGDLMSQIGRARNKVNEMGDEFMDNRSVYGNNFNCFENQAHSNSNNEEPDFLNVYLGEGSAYECADGPTEIEEIQGDSNPPDDHEYLIFSEPGNYSSQFDEGNLKFGN
ncbi:MAG: hypothetical protein JJT75_12225 [Opitutales bacterium]|nr:hypothetical protein [Opitutales bacterium]